MIGFSISYDTDMTSYFTNTNIIASISEKTLWDIAIQERNRAEQENKECNQWDYAFNYCIFALESSQY